MLATSFGASAIVTQSTELTNGGKYFLKTATPEYLSVKDDSLALLTATEFNALDRFGKQAATWEISWTTNISGAGEYTFKNAKSGELLSIADTTGCVFANVKGGINKFTWANPSLGAKLVNESKGVGNAISVAEVFTLTEEYDNTQKGTASYSDLLKSGKGFGHVVSVKAENLNPKDYTPFDVCYDSELPAARKIVKNIDSVFAKCGITDRAKVSEYYKYWANKVDTIKTTNNAKDTIAWNSGDHPSPDIFGASSFTSASNSKLIVGKYGIALNINGTVYGVVEGMPSLALKFAPGTVHIYDLNLMYSAGLGSSEYNLADDIKLTNGLGDNLIGKPANDPSYPDDFVNNFASEADQADSLVAIQLDFTKDSDAPRATDNILEGTNLRFVVRNLLITESEDLEKDAAQHGKSGKNGELATTDFRSALMIQDTLTGKYLYVSDDTYDESTTSTNFKIKWVKLNDLSSKVSNAVKGVTYNNICADDNTVLPHAGSAVFYIKFDKDSSFVIAPRFVYKDKTASADTTGAGYTIVDNKNGTVIKGGKATVAEPTEEYYYRLGLKKFGNSAFLTLINTDLDKEYKIYLKGDATSSLYTPAVTTSDVYFIQYVSQLAANKADNGKYYTADGLKSLTEFEKNNHAENQWALYTDEEDSTVTILNRATAEPLEIGETSIEDQTLYKGIDLKSDFDVYVTLPGGDTLKITSVDPLYKNNAEIGNYVYDKEFNKVSSYEFTYYNCLDNTKKLNVDKNGYIFVDPEGGSAKFTLAAQDTIYGAPAIEGKSVALKKAIYTLNTVIKDTTYFVTVKNGKYAVERNIKDYSPVVFDLQKADSTEWYSFVESDRSGKASVDDKTLQLFKSDMIEPSTSMFAISSETYDIYRRLGTTIKDGIAAYDTAYAQFFKVDEPNRYLYENSSNTVAGKADGRNYLGVYSKKEFNKNASIFVDTAYVANNKIMPTYMLALDASADKASITGRYLVSLSDSAKATYANCTRLAFVDAKHEGDSLIIARVGATAKDTIKIEAGKLNKASFAFELVDKVEKNAEADFYLKNADGYLWITNGVPVLTTEKANAIVFNVEKTSVVPTANEEISAEGVKVIAGEGFVVVKGAEGKKVVVANILGQTVANTVVSSDEAQIAAPAGVVVVSVEGEAAVKAIVK